MSSYLSLRRVSHHDLQEELRAELENLTLYFQARTGLGIFYPGDATVASSILGWRQPDRDTMPTSEHCPTCTRWQTLYAFPVYHVTHRWGVICASG